MSWSSRRTWECGTFFFDAQNDRCINWKNDYWATPEAIQSNPYSMDESTSEHPIVVQRTAMDTVTEVERVSPPSRVQ